MDKDELAKLLNDEVNKQVSNQVENLNQAVNETFDVLDRSENGFTESQKEALRTIAMISMKLGAAAGTTASLNLLGNLPE